MVIMKKNTLILFIIIFHNIGNYTFSQNQGDSLLQILREELFPFEEDDTVIRVSNLCKGISIKDDRVVYAQQPDRKSLIDVFNKIAFTKDKLLVSAMEQIRQEYIEYLKKDWDTFFNIKSGDCNVIVEKIKILGYIEETLLSLKFTSRITDKQSSFNYYVDVQKMWYKYINDDKNGFKAFERFNEFSPYFLNLIRNRIAGMSDLNFDFITPHIEDLKEPLIEYLENYYDNDLQIQKLEIEGYIFFKVLNNIDEERNPLLLDRLIDILITNKNVSRTEFARNVITILKYSEPDGLLEKRIKEELSQPVGVNKMNALLASSYVFRSDFTDTLIDVYHSNVLTDEEFEYIKKVFEVIYRRSYLSKEQRAKIDIILKR